MENNITSDISNINKLDGRVPLKNAIPFGVQHVLAMFVANLAPVFIVASAAGLTGEDISMLIQNIMIAAGIGTLIQLYPIWKIGSRLPIVMGASFTFVAIYSYIGATFGYGAVVGAVIVGGIFEGFVGLSAKYWRKIISPVVSSVVVITIGYSLIGVGVRSFGGGYHPDFGSAQNITLGSITFLTCILFNALAKGYLKQLSILAGLVVGYAIACVIGAVDFSGFKDIDLIALPHLLPFTPEFHLSAILSVCIIYLVSATETIGDTTAMVKMGLDRDATDKEIQGSLACDGFASSISGLFGCLSVTSFSQNVGIIALTKVVNRFTLMTGAVAMILAGFVPAIGVFFSSLPDAVLGGCTIMLFGSIMASGMRMFADAGFTQRNLLIAAITISVGIGFTLPSEEQIWQVFPQVIKDIFTGNCVALVFLLAVILNLVLPKDMEIHPSSAK